MKSLCRSVLLALIFYVAGPLVFPSTPTSRPSEKICVATNKMQMYSNAFVSEESGDIDGYELGVQQNEDKIRALLFLYEGVANEEGIPISGSISNDDLSLTGTWEEHLVQQPSGREIIEKHLVKIIGKLTAQQFFGTISIENLEAPSPVRLTRVRHIWLCKP